MKTNMKLSNRNFNENFSLGMNTGVFQGVNQKRLLAVIVFGIAMMLLNISARAEEFTSVSTGDPECVIPKIDADKVPFPVAAATNTKFDLAEGETYLLNGRVIKKDNQFYFKIDFKSQPWLATQYRLQNPLILIDRSNTGILSKVGSNELVQMAVLVKKLHSLSTTSQNSTEFMMGLDVLAPPVKY